MWDADVEVVDLWLRYLKRNGIGGVGMKAYMYEWVDFGFGSKEVGELEKQLEEVGSQDIQKAAEKLIKELSADLEAEGQDEVKMVPADSGKSSESAPSERTGGNNLVEGLNDVVAGDTLPEVKPEMEEERHDIAEKDGSGRADQKS